WHRWGSWRRTGGPHSGCTRRRCGRSTGWGTDRPRRCTGDGRAPRPRGGSCPCRQSGMSYRRCMPAWHSRNPTVVSTSHPLQHDPLRPLVVRRQLLVILLNLDHAGVVARVTLAGRNGPIEDVGVASLVDSRLFVHLNPGAFAQSDNTGHDPLRHVDRPDDGTVAAAHLDGITVLDAAGGRIHGVHPQMLAERLTKPRHIVQDGVRAAHVVDGDELQGILAVARLFVPFDSRVVDWDRSLGRPPERRDVVRELLAVD